MVELAEIGLILQTISVMSAATAAVIGVRSYINSNKRAEDAKRKEQETRDRELETRQTQLFMGIYERQNQTEFLRHYIKLYQTDVSDVEISAKQLINDSEMLLSVNYIATFYEGLGVLVKEGLIDIRYVALLFAGMTRMLWEKYEKVFFRVRLDFSMPRFVSEYEYLYRALIDYMDKHPELKA
jgi:hypothetical protein